jgi:Tat protein secretion system quality control protein TatD with DNase activity
MLELITNNFILFNKSVDLPERLCGIHLDIEIHALPEWKDATDSRKREMMQLLKDAYKDVKNLLIANGMNTSEVMADIPFWYDSLSAVGWKSEADRKEWFTEVARYINGFSIMNYENNSINSILDRARWERDNFKGIVEIGLDSQDIGTTWKTRAEFREALAHIIDKTKAPVAIHRYVFVMKIPGKPLVREE